MAQNKHVVNISGKDYLTVAGRVALAHDSGRFIGADMVPGDLNVYSGDRPSDYITIKARVRVLNEKNVEIVEKLLKAMPKGSDSEGILAETIKTLLINEYEGIAKSPKEGSDAWKQLPPRSPERSNPTEVCATSALGRALGAAGFGDSESFASADEVFIAQSRQSGYDAPAPITYTSTGNGTLKDAVQSAAAPRTASPNKPPSDKQKKYLQTLSKQKLGIQTPAEFANLVTTKFGKTIDELSSLDVSNWINELADKEA